MKAYEDLYKEAQKDPAYWTAKVTHSFAISINNMMVEKNITKTDLAKKIGVSKAYITKVLRGEANFTVETMVKFSMALGCVIDDIRFLNTQTNLAPISSQRFSFIPPTKRDQA
ncbi:MAG: helix-turn-helix domain-containing protein [Leptospirales bacterium]